MDVNANEDAKAAQTKNMKKGVCRNCGNEFIIIKKPGRVREFCSSACRHRFWNKKRMNVGKDAANTQP